MPKPLMIIRVEEGDDYLSEYIAKALGEMGHEGGVRPAGAAALPARRLRRVVKNHGGAGAQQGAESDPLRIFRRQSCKSSNALYVDCGSLAAHSVSKRAAHGDGQGTTL
jgi:hypothetical protein